MQWTSGVVRHVLPNGLTVLVQRDVSAPVIALLTHVRAGYFDEPDEWVGISHVLEHMYFKGCRTRGPGEIARDVQLLGGYVNAATIYDKTVYYAVLPSTDGALERAMEIQAEALTEATLDANELARELEVVIQEAKRKLDSPPAVAREGLYELLFSTHRMRRWRIGTEAGLQRLSEPDLRQYYGTRYAPERVIAAIVGDLDVDRTLGYAESLFGPWAVAPSEIQGSPPEPDRGRPAMRVLHGDVERALALVGWRTVGTLHPAAAALDLAASLLGRGRGSRLYRTVRAPGLASSTAAMHYTPTEVGVFDLTLEGEIRTLDQAIDRSVAEVAELIEREPAADELERARALVAASWAQQFESMDGKAAVFAQAEALGGVRLADELYDQVMTVTAADVRQAAARFLDPADASAFLYVPGDGSPAPTSGVWPRRPAVPGPTRPAPAAVDLAPRGAARPAGPVAHHPGDVTHVALPGADLLVRAKPGSGLVTLYVHVPGLPERETADNAGISHLAVRTAVRGAGGLDGETLAREAELLGGTVVPRTGADGLGWSMTVRPSCLPKAAELLRRVALEPTFASDEVAVERALQASDARRLRDDMFRHPMQRVLHMAFPADPYGLPTVGDAALVETFTAEQVRAWGSTVATARAVIVAVGDLEAEELLEGLAPLMSWPGATELSGPDGAPTFVGHAGAEERDKAQSALVMAFPAHPAGSPERYASSVMCALLSGLAGRLFEALRDKRSLAYTVAAMPWLRRRAGLVLTYIATSPEREQEAREAMLEELARLAEQPVAEAEMDRARNYAAGAVAIGRQRGAAVAADLLDAWLYGGLDEFADPGTAYLAITAPAVRDLARRVFVETDHAAFTIRGSGKSR